MCDRHPIFSRCRLGGGRWFWLVYSSWQAIFGGEETLATGYAATAEEAEQTARSIAPDCVYWNASTASHYHRNLCNKRRVAKPPGDGAEVTPQEFLYRDYTSDYDEDWHSAPHLIVKKTTKLVFVEKHTGNREPWDRETYALDRAELEATGSVWSRSAREIFFTTPCEQRRQQWVPDDLATLNLEAGASSKEIKTAYRRLARQHHPDRGGDAEKFKSIQNAYELAMQR